MTNDKIFFAALFLTNAISILLGFTLAWFGGKTMLVVLVPMALVALMLHDEFTFLNKKKTADGGNR